MKVNVERLKDDAIVAYVGVVGGIAVAMLLGAVGERVVLYLYPDAEFPKVIAYVAFLFALMVLSVIASVALFFIERYVE